MKITKVLIGLLCLFIIITLIAGIFQYISIQKIGDTAQPEQADVIIVLGAGVWEHGPSPAMIARVEQAAEMYHQGYSQHIIVSGGLGTFPPTEAEAMETLLLSYDIPADHISLEMDSTNTFENIKFSKKIMQQLQATSAIIVTDAFHMKRALKIARNSDIVASGSSAKNSVLYTNKQLRLKYTVREVLAMAKYNVERIINLFGLTLN